VTLTLKKRSLVPPLVLLSVAIVLTVSGELLLKQGMIRNGELHLAPDTLVASLAKLATNPFVLGGFALIFSGSIFWLSVISQVPLSYAYPMLSTSYILVVGASWLVLGEQITWLRLAGVLVIMAGVSLVARSGQ